MRLRVATYNIRKCIGLDWRRNPERVIAVIEDLGADIVVLQEADRRFGKKLSTLSHDHLGHLGWVPVPFARHHGGIGWHGNAMLVREGIEVSAVYRCALPALEPRGAVFADLLVEGSALRTVGAHLGLTHGMRLRQATHILGELERMPPYPTIIMGDFNNWNPNAGCISVFGRHFDFAPPAPTFHARRPVAPLDRIGVTPGVRVVEQGVFRDGRASVASDHLPLWADIELTGEVAAAS